MEEKRNEWKWLSKRGGEERGMDSCGGTKTAKTLMETRETGAGRRGRRDGRRDEEAIVCRFMHVSVSVYMLLLSSLLSFLLSLLTICREVNPIQYT